MTLSRESDVAMIVSHVQTTDSGDTVIRHDKCQILEKMSLLLLTPADWTLPTETG